MARIDASEVTFCVTDDESMWGTNIAFPTLVRVLRYLKTAVDTSVFKVWVVQEGRVTHVVPYKTFCEVAMV